MKDLSCICLWASVGSENREVLDRTLRVLRWCRNIALWRDVLLFNACPELKEHPDFKVIQIPVISDVPYGPNWQIFQTKIIPRLLLGEGHYPYTMNVHEDGFPIDLTQWTDDFFRYDWVGPVWHDGVVGGSSIALRSRAMLQAMQEIGWHDGSVNDDEWVCRRNREQMESRGMLFPPREVASQFCTETQNNDKPSFAFHHRTHSPEKYKRGWEMIEEWEATQK
jgi:hypothetical protein